MLLKLYRLLACIKSLRGLRVQFVSEVAEIRLQVSTYVKFYADDLLADDR